MPSYDTTTQPRTTFTQNSFIGLGMLEITGPSHLIGTGKLLQVVKIVYGLYCFTLRTVGSHYNRYILE